MLPRHLQTVERRIHNADIRALRLSLSEAGARARYLEHITKGRDNHVITQRIGDGLVHIIIRGHADRAARPRDQIHILGQQLPDTRTENSYGMCAADLHKAQMPVRLCRQAADFCHAFLGERPICFLQPFYRARRAVHLGEQGVRFVGVLFLDNLHGKPRMYEYIVPDLRLGQQHQRDIPRDPADFHLTYRVFNRQHFSWYG